MSEEEKEAIQILKDWLCKTHSEFCKVGAIGIPDKEFFATETVLNLIEKQQKEIENLKEINKEHQKLNGELRDEIKRQGNTREIEEKYIKKNFNIIRIYDEFKEK